MITYAKKIKNRYNLNAILEITQEQTHNKSEQSMLIKILDTDYKPANLDELVGKANNFNEEQKNPYEFFWINMKNYLMGP